MKYQSHRTFALYTAFVLLLIVINVSAQQSSEGVSLNFILSKLIGTREVSNPQEIDELVLLIQIRKANFALSFQDEESIRNVGANDVLIKAIDDNASERVKREISVEVFSMQCETDAADYQKSKRKLESFKKYVRLFRNDPEHETAVAYLKKNIPIFESKLEKHRMLVEQNAILTDKIIKNLESDNLKKALFGEFLQNYLEDTERQKIALQAAGEIVKKYGEDTEIANLIEFIKNNAPVLEKLILESKSH